MKRKANDSIPADEMLLAEAIAAASALKLRHCIGTAFLPSDINGRFDVATTGACCAIGAIALAVGDVKRSPYTVAREVLTDRRIGKEVDCVYDGNDDDEWGSPPMDSGESLGWAYRCAMEDQ